MVKYLTPDNPNARGIVCASAQYSYLLSLPGTHYGFEYQLDQDKIQNSAR